MTEVQKYLAEEIGLECVDGHIPRREALRRLALLGLSGSAAAALLAACAKSASNTAGASSSAAQTTSSAAATTTAPASTTSLAGTGPPVPTQAITFPGPTATLMGAFAPASSPKGGVLVIHENRGLTDHITSVAGRLARDGYSALAIDLLSEEGGTPAVPDAAAALSAASQNAERFPNDMKAGVTELEKRLSGKKLGIIGFCFGGMQVWSALQAGEARLAAAVPFYGPAPAEPDFSKAKAAVLAVYAGLDDRVNASRDRAVAALQKAGLPSEVITYPGVNHAFHNDTGGSYNADAAKKAYQAALDWFGKYLK